VILESFFSPPIIFLSYSKTFQNCKKILQNLWVGQVTRRFREFFLSTITAAYKTAFLGRWHRYERHGVCFAWNEGVCEIKMGKKSSKVDSFFQLDFLFNLSFFFAHDLYFCFSPNFAVSVSLSHFGWIFHAKLAHSSSSSSF
jgi:hypothetical protein